jgi:L-histidine N-alpha-methyltransferase
LLEAPPHARIVFLKRSTEDPLAHDGPNIIRNLTGSPKKIACVYVYDERGSEFFERQCETPEYYLRRAEARMLRQHAGDIVNECGLVPIVELGAGTAQKTRLLFMEYQRRGARCDYFPIDVDSTTLFEAAYRLTSAFPRLHVHCLGTTYEKGLRALANHSGRRLFLFLGSSIGNMELRDIDDLLGELFRNSAQGDYLLVGADLDKDPAIINRAYNDSAGYGAQSTLNMLRHLNRRYRGDFVLDRFRYRSQYDPCVKRNEVKIESLVDQTITLADLGLSVSLRAAEPIDAEVMWKFDPDALGAILERAGLVITARWIDPDYRYGLFLSRRQ